MPKCACGTGSDYLSCCGKYIENNAIPATPEALMRSRYTAYTQANISYILKTMIAPANRHFNAAEAAAWAKRITWVRLEVVTASTQGNKGFVEFYAYFNDQGKQQAIHEQSEFRLIKNRWYYSRGKLPVR